LATSYVFQGVIPRANFNCNGQITGVIASMNRTDSGVNDASIQVWHPTTPDGDVFDKVGEIKLVESEITEEVDNNNNTYWLVNITLNGDDRIEFEAGDVIGYYQPPDTHHILWFFEVDGYIAYANFFNISSNKFSLDNSHISQNSLQPLLQFLIGKNSLYVRGIRKGMYSCYNLSYFHEISRHY